MHKQSLTSPPFANLDELRAFLYANRGVGFIAYADGVHAYTVLAGEFRGYEARFDEGPKWRYHLNGHIEQMPCAWDRIDCRDTRPERI